MFLVYALTAAVGCTILVFQFVLTMIGMAGDSLDIDVGDMDPDVDIDLDAGGDIDVDTGGGHVSSNWLAGVISFKTIVAFLAFFGLGGLTADSLQLGTIVTLLIATVCGTGALFTVYYLFLWLARLRSDGTPRIRMAVGCEATVYTTIPANHSGMGKIQMNLQGRTMEYSAQTGGPALSPNAIVIVTAVLSSETVEVEAENRPADQTE